MSAVCSLSGGTRFALGVVGLSALASVAIGASQVEQRIPLFDRFCGKLVLVDDLNASTVKVKKPLQNNTVQLYPKPAGEDCCAGLSPEAVTVTGRGGNFEFKLSKPKAGLYWLTFMIDGREFKQLIRYEPPKSDPMKCSDKQFEMDAAGRFTLAEMVTVD